MGITENQFFNILGCSLTKVIVESVDSVSRDSRDTLIYVTVQGKANHIVHKTVFWVKATITKCGLWTAAGKKNLI